jgi:hypothetical protein
MTRSRTLESKRALEPGFRFWRAALTALLVLALGAWVWTPLAPLFSWTFRVCAGAALAGVSFGQGGHVDVEPRASPRAQDVVALKTALRLSIDGVEPSHVLRINPRRLLYLPLLCFLALLIAAPLPGSNKLRCALLGVPLLAGMAVGSLWASAAWLFARVPGLVYDASDLWFRHFLQILYEGLVTPPASKFVLPLLLAALLVSWQLRTLRAADLGARGRACRPKAEANGSAPERDAPCAVAGHASAVPTIASARAPEVEPAAPRVSTPSASVATVRHESVSKPRRRRPR